MRSGFLFVAAVFALLSSVMHYVGGMGLVGPSIGNEFTLFMVRIFVSQMSVFMVVSAISLGMIAFGGLRDSARAVTYFSAAVFGINALILVVGGYVTKLMPPEFIVIQAATGAFHLGLMLIGAARLR